MKKKILLLFAIIMVNVHAIEMRPIPWLTEGGIEFLEDYFKQHPDARVLEFGSGASTVWIAKRVKELHSVEHHGQWHESVVQAIEKDSLSDHVFCYLREKPYYGICEEFENESFDLILVDGRNRKGCVAHALPKLKKGGLLVLDDAEREFYFPVYTLMENWETCGYIQTKPDSCGFYYHGKETRWWKKPE